MFYTYSFVTDSWKGRENPVHTVDQDSGPVFTKILILRISLILRSFLELLFFLEKF